MPRQHQHKLNQASTGMLQPWDPGHMHKLRAIAEVARRWESFDVDTKKNYVKVKIDDLRQHSLTHYPDSTPLIEVDVDETMDVNLNVWYCYRCHECFLTKDDFTFHDDLYLEDYFVAQEIALPKICRDTKNALLDSIWLPLDPLGTMVSDRFEAQRVALLNGIKEALELMIENGSLCETHVDLMRILVQAAFEDNEEMMKYLKYADLHFGICCLDARRLAKILKHLTTLVSASEPYQGLPVSPPLINHADEPPKIRLNTEKTEFLVDFRAFPKKRVSPEERGTVNLVDAIKFGQWLCADYAYKERRELWDVWTGQVKSHMEDLFSSMESRLESLRSACNQKSKLMALYRLCNEVPKLGPGHAEALLRQRDEIEQAQGGETDESSAITDLLIEADELDAQTKNEMEDYLSAFSDSDIGDEVVQKAAKTIVKKTPKEVLAVEARIRGVSFVVEQITSNIRTTSKLNFRYLLMPLVNSFLKVRMQELIASEVSPQGPSEEPSEDTYIATEANVESRRSTSEVAESSTSGQTSRSRRRGKGRGS